MGRFFTSRDADAAKQWLQDHYQPYPKGVRKLYSPRLGGPVSIKLDEPLDLDLLKSIVERHGLRAEINQDKDGTRVLNVYNSVEDESGVIVSGLRSVFRERSQVDISEEPINSGSPHPRLVYITEYLNAKYS